MFFQLLIEDITTASAFMNSGPDGGVGQQGDSIYAGGDARIPSLLGTKRKKSRKKSRRKKRKRRVKEGSVPIIRRTRIPM